MLTWLANVWSLSQGWVVALSVVSVVTFVACLLALPRLFASLPEDYFTSDRRPKRSLKRNLLGVVLLAVGVAMLVLPGQGVLTILAGVMLLDFRGKAELERRILGRPRVLQTINRIRARRGRPPLQAPLHAPG